MASQSLSRSAPNDGLEVDDRFCRQPSGGIPSFSKPDFSIKTAPDSELFGDQTETLSASQAIHVLSDHHGIRSVASFRRGSSV